MKIEYNFKISSTTFFVSTANVTRDVQCLDNKISHTTESFSTESNRCVMKVRGCQRGRLLGKL